MGMGMAVVLEVRISEAMETIATRTICLESTFCGTFTRDN